MSGDNGNVFSTCWPFSNTVALSNQKVQPVH